MVTKRDFGYTKRGESVECYRITDTDGSYAEIMTYGAALRALCVPDRDGRPVDVILGYDTVEEYETKGGFLGATVGRFANRIGKGRFTLNGVTYQIAKTDGENVCHGGLVGFDKRIFRATEGENEVTFTRLSPDMEENFPGNLILAVTFRFAEHTLTITYRALTDRDTVINFTNHAYFNLAGEGDILDEILTVNAEKFAENDVHCLPTGRLLDVAGTAFDFRAGKAIGTDIESDEEQIQWFHGYDHNFGVGEAGVLKQVATLVSPKNGIVMTTSTTQPGMQVYTSNGMTGRKTGKGRAFCNHAAVCLETQGYPDAPNRENFPSAVLRAGEPYESVTRYAFGIAE